MMIKFNNQFGKMKLETKVRSIFDTVSAGQIGIDGEYYIIHKDHKTHEYYAVTKETEKEMDSIGDTLASNEEAAFNGEKVRGITDYEEELYNRGMLLAYVDLWGNIAIEEEFDVEWYVKNCL